MKIVGILLVFVGYVFIYAATASGGRFATEPWAGLFADAYSDIGSGLSNIGTDIAQGVSSVG